MPRSTDLFIDHPDDHQFLAHLGSAVHQRLEEGGEGRWRLQLPGGHEAGLRRQRPSSPFAAYRWDLRARSDFDGPIHEDPVAVAVRGLADDLVAAGCRVLVVHDLHLRRPPRPPATTADLGSGSAGAAAAGDAAADADADADDASEPVEV